MEIFSDSSRKRVAAFTIAIARALGSSNQEIRVMARGAFLHEVGGNSFPLAECAAIVHAQHEAYDGTGFPKGLKGDEIPLGARILRVAYAFEAMTAGGAPYRAVSISEAKEEIEHGSGTLFDPSVVNTFLGIPDGIWADLIEELPDNHR